MRALSSLRWKIALTTTMVCCMVAAALGILVHNVVARQIVGEVRKEADAELDHALGHYEYGTAHGDVNAALDPPDLPARLRALVARGRTGSMVGEQKDEPVMWAAGPADDKALAVWIPYGSTRDRLRDIDTAILASSALAAGVVALAGLFLADRISRRLATTAAVARRISAGDLDARVGFPADGDDPGPGGTRDEVRDVAHALDSMAGSLQDRLEAEKRFTADVAHELRTPLTGSLAAASLLPEGRPKEMINDRLKALHLLTEDLLEISRLDSGVRTGRPGPGGTRPGGGTGRRGGRAGRLGPGDPGRGGAHRPAPPGPDPGQPAGQRPQARPAARRGDRGGPGGGGPRPRARVPARADRAGPAALPHRGPGTRARPRAGAHDRGGAGGGAGDRAELRQRSGRRRADDARCFPSGGCRTGVDRGGRCFT